MPAVLEALASASLVEEALTLSITEFVIKRHDESPALEAVVYGPDGAPLDLSEYIGAAFYVAGRDLTGRLMLRIAGAAELDVDAHTLRYSWEAGDTALSGVFEAEFELVDEEGRTRSVPTLGNITVRVIDDLDDA